MIEDPFCAEKLLRISVRAVYGYIHDWPNLVFKLASEMGFRPSRLIGLAESNLGLALWPNLAQWGLLGEKFWDKNCPKRHLIKQTLKPNSVSWVENLV